MKTIYKFYSENGEEVEASKAVTCTVLEIDKDGKVISTKTFAAK